ncbi:MAG: hypothetical protein ABI547_00220 [Betaproteobacteria bacterium]
MQPKPVIRYAGAQELALAGENIMQAALLTTKASNPKGLLYPLLVIAAIAVIIFSVLGAAAIAGWLPRAQSGNQSANANSLPQTQRAPAAPSAERGIDYRVADNRTADYRGADHRATNSRTADNREVKVSNGRVVKTG